MSRRKRRVRLCDEVKRDRRAAASDHDLSESGTEASEPERESWCDREKQPLSCKPEHDRSDAHDEPERRRATDLRRVARGGYQRVGPMIDEPSQPRRIGARQAVVTRDVLGHATKDDQRSDESGDPDCDSHQPRGR